MLSGTAADVCSISKLGNEASNRRCVSETCFGHGRAAAPHSPAVGTFDISPIVAFIIVGGYSRLRLRDAFAGLANHILCVNGRAGLETNSKANVCSST